MASKNEAKTTKAPKDIVRLYGNLGADILEHELKTKPGTSYKAYDPATDSVVDRQPRTFKSFSIAVNYKDENGEKQTRWITVLDFKGLSDDLHLMKGDRVCVQGEIRKKTFTKKDETEGSETQLIANEIWRERSKEEQKGQDEQPEAE